MTEDPKVIAQEILSDVLDGPLFAGLVGELLEEAIFYEGGDVQVSFGGESPEGFGAFSCDYLPLDAVAKLDAECARIVDEFTVRAQQSDGSAAVAKMADEVAAGPRASHRADISRAATFFLLASLRNRVAEAIEAAYASALLYARARLAQDMAAAFDKLGTLNNPEADMRELVEASVRRAAEREAALYRDLFTELKFDYVITVARRGRPRKVTTVRVRSLLRRQGKVSAEKAAELLSCEVSAVKDWARSTEWGTWSKARAALLTELKTGGN